MASILLSDNGVSSGTAGLKSSADSSGVLVLQTTNGSGTATTALSLDTSQNMAFNSGYGSVATAYGCRAWVNFNGTGTVAIRASGNVSSITDNGVGDYTVNFATAMVDTNYCVQISVRNITSNLNSSNNPTYAGSQLTSGINIGHIENNAATDSNFVHVAIFR